MFTGIVQSVGRIEGRDSVDGAIRLVIGGADFESELSVGDSVAVAGVCLTVVERSSSGFAVEAVPTTARRTTVGGWSIGDRVNLEPALRAGDPLGGHFVQGHVDGVGEVQDVVQIGADRILKIRLPPAVADITVPQGSMTLDGVSLTVSALAGAVAEFAIIPYTWSHTTLSRLRPGDRVNVEGDPIGKHVRRAVLPYVSGAAGPEPEAVPLPGESSRD